MEDTKWYEKLPKVGTLNVWYQGKNVHNPDGYVVEGEIEGERYYAAGCGLEETIIRSRSSISEYAKSRWAGWEKKEDGSMVKEVMSKDGSKVIGMLVTGPDNG